MLKDEYKINIYLQDKYPHDPGGRDIYKYQVEEYLENLYENMNILFNNNLPTDLHIAFQIIKLLIEKEEENSSEAESDTSEDENVAEIQTYENNGEQNNTQESKLPITNFEV